MRATLAGAGDKEERLPGNGGFVMSTRVCGTKGPGAVGRSAEAGLGHRAPWAGSCAAASGKLPLRQPGVAWAAPSSSESSEEEAPRPHHHARRSDNTQLIVIGGVALLAVILLLFIGFSIGAGKPTLNDLRQRIGVPLDATTVSVDVPYRLFCNRVGIPHDIQKDANYCYLFYRVQEGTARIAVERHDWDEGEHARVRDIRMVY